MSSQPAEIPLGLGEPPVSLPAPEGAEVDQTPAPAPMRPPLEAQLVQEGKLSMGQLAQAHRDRLEKGGSVLDIVVERGWVSAEEVARLRAEHGEPAPAPVVNAVQSAEPQPEPAAAAPTPAAETTQPPPADPDPEPISPAAWKVAIRLTNGELITAGQAANADEAEMLAQVVVADVSTPGESWPRVQGRYLRPETIVSVDIVAA